MKEGVVLVDGHIVYLDEISDMQVYNHENSNVIFDINTGRVIRFKKDGIFYMPFYKNNNIFLGYYPEKQFWKKEQSGYMQDKDLKKDDLFFISDFTGFRQNNRFDPLLSNIPVGSNIILVFNSVKYNLDDPLSPATLIIRKTTFKSSGKKMSSSDLIQNTPVLETTIDIDFIAHYISSVYSKKFNDNNGVESFNERDLEILIDITYLFLQLYKSQSFQSRVININHLVKIFDQHFKNINDVQFHYLSKDQFQKYYNREYFYLLRLRLIEFKNWINLISEQATISEQDVLAQIVRLFDLFDMSVLTYQIKMLLIKQLVDGDIKFILNRAVKAETINKLIQSISIDGSNQEDIDQFFNYLMEKNTVTESGNLTNFEILYNHITDPKIGSDGSGHRKDFVTAVFKLWNFSRYNPFHANELIANNALDHFKYTPYIAQNNNDKTASPLILNYESSKIYFWYKDNFKFYFNKNKIEAQKIVRAEYQHTFWDDAYTPTHSGESKMLIGNYDIFQPISITVSDSIETLIRLPVLNMPPETQEQNRGQYINNCIPIFYLKYVDDVGDWSDFKNTIGLLVDIVTTFSGIGNLAKLRHLKKISFARAFFQDQHQKVALLKALSMFFSVSETILGLANLCLEIDCSQYDDQNGSVPVEGDANYEKYQRCQSIQRWLTAFEIFSLTGDFISAWKLKKATQELAEFDMGDLQDGAIISNKIGEIIEVDEVSDFINKLPDGEVKVFVNGLGEEFKQKFYLDFERKRRPLFKEMNTQMCLNWKLLSESNVPKDYRKLIRILRKQNRVETIKTLYNYPDLVTYFQKLPDLKVMVRFIDQTENLDFALIENYPYWIKQWNQISNAHQVKFVEHLESWIKLRKSLSLVKANKIEELAELYRYNILPTPDSHIINGKKYLVDGLLDKEYLKNVDKIAQKEDEIIAIVNNTGIPRKYIEAARDNYFIKYRVKKYDENTITYGRFERRESDDRIGDIEEWEKAIAGYNKNETNMKKEFTLLIAHEYIETKLIDDYGVNYQSLIAPIEFTPFSYSAHDLSPNPLTINAPNRIASFERKGGISYNFSWENLDFSEWDRLIEQYVKFYDLDK